MSGPTWDPAPYSGPSTTGGPSWYDKWQPSGHYYEPEQEEPYEHWAHIWHLWPGNLNQGQFRTTAPVVESALLSRPWEIPELRYIAEQNPDGWRSTYEGVSELTTEPWKFEVDTTGRLKCLACSATTSGSCGAPGHDRPGLRERAREAFKNKPPPPQIRNIPPPYPPPERLPEQPRRSEEPQPRAEQRSGAPRFAATTIVEVPDGHGRLQGPREWSPQRQVQQRPPQRDATQGSIRGTNAPQLDASWRSQAHGSQRMSDLNLMNTMSTAEDQRRSYIGNLHGNREARKRYF